ncbi:MAG: hypothetical protein ABSA11_11560 [Candidatus Bathyarchaeia archaeon]|jgi:hypothetical protein
MRTKLFEDAHHVKAERMRIIEFMRVASQSSCKLNPTILVLTGLPNLLNSPYTEDTDPIPLLHSALLNLSRETILIINADRLEWSPSNRTDISAKGRTIPVSEIDIQGTTTLKSRIKLGTGRGRRKDNFIKVNW